MVIQCEIHYDDNPYGIYFAGQTVKGRAVVLLNEPLPTKGITLKVHGYARVSWEESSSTTNSDGTTSTTSDSHFDMEKYFKAKTECLNTNGMEHVLGPGTYTYTFQSVIPPECPSSFEGYYGHIRYEAVLTIVRPMRFNKSYSKAFNVLAVFDLNPMPQLRIPAQMEYMKTFCCGPCKSKPVVLTADVARTGYVPGDNVDVNVRLVNHSNVLVEYIGIKLNLVGSYSVRHRVSTKGEKIMTANKIVPVTVQKAFEIKDSFRIPPTPPTCVDKCQIIKITYEVEILAKVGGAHISPIVVIPITVGNIPYVDKSTSSMSEEMLLDNLRNGLSLEPHTNSHAEIQPPSYEEAAFIQPSKALLRKKNKDDELTSENFTPRYPYYNETVPTAPPKEL